MLEELKKSMSEIKMSDEKKEKIIERCYKKNKKSEDYVMSNRIKLRKASILAAAIMAICVISAGAVITHIRGFRDVVKGGVIVGTEFDEETETINLTAETDGEILLVSVSVLDYKNPPYSETEEFGISNYEIVDKDGNIPEKNNGTMKSENGFTDGKATFEIPIYTLPSGEYTLIINGFELSKKADQPLHVNGKWVCTFIK